MELTLEQIKSITTGALNIFEDADGILYYRDGDPIVEVLQNKTFNIDLKPGEGVFMIPLYKK